MANVHVTGLPKSVEMPKIIFKFKHILSKYKVKKFWISEFGYTRGCDFKEAKIQLQTIEDAFKVRNVLDGFAFSMNNQSSQLSAVISKQTKGVKEFYSQPNNKKSSLKCSSYLRPHDSFEKQYSKERDRSRSPVFNTKSKLNIELELLRKQRMVVEEERRLLLEHKKLELVKEFGASAAMEIERFDQERRRSRDRDRDFDRLRERERVRDYSLNRHSDYSPDRHREYGRVRARDMDHARTRDWDHRRDREFNRSYDHDHPRGRNHSRDRDRYLKSAKIGRSAPPLPRINVQATYTLPRFLHPCKLLMLQMKKVITKHCELSEKQALIKLLNVTLRKRIALVLKDVEQMKNSEEILKIYRNSYPINQDEEFITSILKKIRMCHWVKRPDDTIDDKQCPDSPKQDVTHTDAGKSSNSDNIMENDNIIKVNEKPNNEVNSTNNEQIIKSDEVQEIKEANECINLTNEESNLPGKEDYDVASEEDGDVTTVELMIDGPDEEVQEIKETNECINLTNEESISPDKEEFNVASEGDGDVTTVELMIDGPDEEVQEIKEANECINLTNDDSNLSDKEGYHILASEGDGDVTTVEIMIDGPDEEWVVDGTNWDDDEINTDDLQMQE